MQVFRRKFLYNSQKPVFVSQKVKTFQCMNTETKDQRLLLLQHLTQVPFVEPSPFILQPIESPSMEEPFSVYPFVECCSNIKKLNEADAMYILKCLTQAKLKKPLYYVLAPQGICVSDVEGLLPEKSPSLFEIAINMLDLPQSLAEVQKSLVSKDGFDVCKAIKNGEDPTLLFAKWGWKQSSKRDKSASSAPTDDDFWIFKGKRKQQGPFGQEYSLAWNQEHNLCRFKYIDLSKNGYQQEFYQDFDKKIQVFKKATTQKFDLLNICKYVKDNKGIKIFSELPNQGSLTDYITTRYTLGRTMTEKNTMGMLEQFVQNMRSLVVKSPFKSFGNLNIKNLYVHNSRIYIGEPLLITDSAEKKIRQLKNGMDYFAPELKENILMAENLMKLDFEKMDVWFFGFMLHKIIVREVPVFDPTRKPLLDKHKLSPGMLDLISRCLSLTPANRPSWQDINLRQLQKQVFLEEVQQIKQSPAKEIKLGTRKQRISSGSSMRNKLNQPENYSSNKKLLRSSEIIEDEFEKLKSEEVIEEEKPTEIVVPMTPKFKRFKLILKIILVMVLYIFVFFRPFLWGSLSTLLVRGYYTTTSVHLTSQSGDIVSTSTILTSTPQYFMLNDITFQTMYTKLHCIDNNFNPIHDPSYQLNSFIQSGSFLLMILMGWMGFVVVCVTKSISIWRGGIGNHLTAKNRHKYWLAYAFHEMSLAALLFAHFYIFQFFYFSQAEPCLGITNFGGIEPFFDSSLYIFLGNTAEYMRTVFACLVILGLIILLSTCFYAWGPKLDSRHIVSVLTLIFRFLPYVLFILFCRVGIFFVLNPTAINDENNILESLVSESFTGFIGVIPEIFILICIVLEVLYEILMKWFQKKAIESNKLARFFGWKKGKNDLSKVSRLQSLNQMSLDNSKNHLTMDD